MLFLAWVPVGTKYALCPRHSQLMLLDVPILLVSQCEVFTCFIANLIYMNHQYHTAIIVNLLILATHRMNRGPHVFIKSTIWLMQIHEISVYMDATELVSIGTNAYFRPYTLVSVNIALHGNIYLFSHSPKETFHYDMYSVNRFHHNYCVQHGSFLM